MVDLPGYAHIGGLSEFDRTLSKTVYPTYHRRLRLLPQPCALGSNANVRVFGFKLGDALGLPGFRVFAGWHCSLLVGTRLSRALLLLGSFFRVQLSSGSSPVPTFHVLLLLLQVRQPSAGGEPTSDSAPSLWWTPAFAFLSGLGS